MKVFLSSLESVPLVYISLVSHCLQEVRQVQSSFVVVELT